MPALAVYVIVVPKNKKLCCIQYENNEYKSDTKLNWQPPNEESPNPGKSDRETLTYLEKESTRIQKKPKQLNKEEQTWFISGWNSTDICRNGMKICQNARFRASLVPLSKPREAGDRKTSRTSVVKPRFHDQNFYNGSPFWELETSINRIIVKEQVIRICWAQGTLQPKCWKTNFATEGLLDLEHNLRQTGRKSSRRQELKLDILEHS